MTIRLDDPLRPIAATGSAGAPVAVPHVHPAARVNLEPRPVALFEVIAEPVNGRLDLVGELDLAGGQRFRDASAAIVAGGSAHVVIDLARLRFIDAGGIGLLISLSNELAARGATVRIENPDARVEHVFSLCGLEAMLTMPVAL